MCCGSSEYLRPVWSPRSAFARHQASYVSRIFVHAHSFKEHGSLSKITSCSASQKTVSDTQNHLRSVLFPLFLATSICLLPGSAFADPPASEVPAAVNSVVTVENAAIERQKEEDSKRPSQAKLPEREKQNEVALELTINGETAGKIIIRVFQEPPVGSQRFLDLAKRQAGGYRLSKVDGISDGFITVSGVLQQNYAGMPQIAGGETVEQLEAEQSLFQQNHDRRGLVSLIVEDADPKDVRERVVAYGGKFIKVQEVRGASNANGTGFAITLAPSPILDKTNLIVGEVIEGLDVIEKVAKLPKVKSSSQSPFFKVAKALGDRRADVAARSFGKPLGKVIVTKVTVQQG